MGDIGDDKELGRLSRVKARAVIKRTTVISNIRAIHAMALLVDEEPAIIPEFLIAASDLEMLWTRFRSEDDSVLDYLVELDKMNDYFTGLIIS